MGGGVDDRGLEDGTTLRRRTIIALGLYGSGASFMGCAGSPPVGGGTAVQPGTFKGSEINALLASGSDVDLTDGVYELDVPLDVPSERRITGAGSGRTVLVPAFTPSSDEADAPENALIRVRGTVHPEVLDTQLTSVAVRDMHEIQLVSAAGIEAGAWLRIHGHNDPATEQYLVSSGMANVLTEVVRVADSYVGGKVIPLAHTIAQHHTVLEVGVQSIAPALNIALAGFDLAGDGGAVAVGILAEHAVGLTISDVSGGGFSRALIEPRLGTRDFNFDRLHSRGNINSLVLSNSVMNGTIADVTCSEDGAYHHLAGVPRALLNFRSRCTGVRVARCTLSRGCVGIRLWGGQDLSFDDIVIRDIDAAGAVERDSEVQIGFLGVGVDMGTGDLMINENALAISFSNVQLENCRQPSDRGQCGWLLHDTQFLSMSNCSITNEGKHPSPSGSTGSAYSTGFRAQDVSGVIDQLTIKGVNWAFRASGSSVDLDIGSLNISGIAANGISTSGGLELDYFQLGAGPRIGELSIQNVNRPVVFGSDWHVKPDWSLMVEESNIDGLYYSSVTTAFFAGSGAPAAGAVVRIDEASPAGERHIVPCDGPTTANAVVVSSPGLFGGYCLIASLPTAHAVVRCTDAAVPLGGLLVASGQAGCAETIADPPEPLTVLGKAMQAKAAGAQGLVRIAPA